MPIRDITVTVRIVVEPDDGAFYAHCPDLKGLHVDGETREEALENAKVAVCVHLRSMLNAGDPLPVGVVETNDYESVLPLLKEKFSRLLRRNNAPTSYIETISLPAAA